MDKITTLFNNLQTTLMTIGGSVIVLALIVAGIITLFALRGEGLRKALSMILTIALGGILIGGAVFFAGLFIELGKHLGN